MAVIARGRELLQVLAQRHGLDGLMELVSAHEGRVGPEPEQRAFALVSFGLPLYREMAHKEYFPAVSRTARRRGARGVRESLVWPEGERAVIFMTHALPAFASAFWECQARKGTVDDPSIYTEYHGSIRALLQEYYPLESEDEDALAEARCEVDVFETREPVATIGVPQTGYEIGRVHV